MGTGNSIFVQTEKPSYVGGEEVRGTVQMNIVEPVSSQGVFLKIKGCERTNWQVERTRTVQGTDGAGNPTTRSETYTESFNGLNTFFKVKVPIYPVSGYVTPGGYSFPFSFMLPPGLPGVFFERAHRHTAAVFYKLKAEVHVAGLFKSNIKHTQRLVINERLDTAVAPISREARTNVTQCCCFNKGTAWMRATFDKNAYVPGEEARVVVEANNESSVDISAIRSKLKRRLTLHDNSGRQHVMVDTVAQGTYPGLPKFTSAMGDAARYVPLILQNRSSEPVQPQTHGRLVECVYWVEAELDVPWGGDVRVDLPTTIYAPIPVIAAPVAPPGWAPTAMEPVRLDISNPAFAY